MKPLLQDGQISFLERTNVNNMAICKVMRYAAFVPCSLFPYLNN